MKGLEEINDEFNLSYNFELPVGMHEELSGVCCVFKAHEVDLREKHGFEGDRHVIPEA